MSYPNKSALVLAVVVAALGICAHESATRGGEFVRLPDFTLTL